MIKLLFILPIFLQIPIIRKDHYQKVEQNPNDKLYFIDNKIDHFNLSDFRTYKQRYWVNDQFWDFKQGPIFIYICGEAECAPRSIEEYAWKVAAELSGRLVTVEHRYYGISQPFDDYSTENLKYLNSTQALADLHYFILQMNQSVIQNQGFQPQFVCVGGSYPGALSAWFKSLYPNDVVAAWSSSGVINPIQDFTDFDMDIYNASLKSGNECTTFIQNFTNKLDNSILSGETQIIEQAIKTLGGYSDNITQKIRYDEFMFFVADIFTIGVQYGKRGQLCDMLSQIQNETFENQLIVLGDFAKNSSVTYDFYAYQSLQNTTISHEKNGRQWTYQYCTEFGWFQMAYPYHPMRSQLLYDKFWIDYCQRVFLWEQPRYPAINLYRQIYGGVDIQGENIFFMNAGEDPWQYASIRKLNDRQQSKMRSILMDCENCGHCIDLHKPFPNDPIQVVEARQAIKQQIILWLQEDRQKIA